MGNCLECATPIFEEDLVGASPDAKKVLASLVKRLLPSTFDASLERPSRAAIAACRIFSSADPFRRPLSKTHKMIVLFGNYCSCCVVTPRERVHVLTGF